MTGIIDPRNGNAAAVDNKGRMAALASTKDEAVDASIDGDTYYLSTQPVNLTTDGESWLYYLENTDTVAWVVSSMFATIGATVGGSGNGAFLFGQNITGGTVADAGNPDILPANLNTASRKPLPAVAKLGGEGRTAVLAGGSEFLWPAGVAFQTFPGGPIVIAPGTSFVFGFRPPTGNTSQDVQFSMTLYRRAAA